MGGVVPEGFQGELHRFGEFSGLHAFGAGLESTGSMKKAKIYMAIAT